MIGRSHRHHKGVAGGKWLQRAQKTPKVFKPNLHAFKGIFKGRKGKWLLCTKCLRRVKSSQTGSRDWPVITKGDFTGRKVNKANQHKPAPKKETPAEKNE